MKTKKTANGSSCKKGKLFDGLISKHASEMDPCYKLFLENLREDGHTYVLDVPNGDHGMPVSVRYEEDDTSYGNTKASTPNFPNGSLHRRQGVPNGKRPDVKAVNASGSVDHSFSPKRAYVKQKKTPSADESYELFLSLVKFKDGFMAIEPEPGVTIVYEREEDMPARYDELRTGSSRNEPEPLVAPLENMEEDYTMYGCEYGLAQANKIASEHEMDGPSSENIDDQDVICTDERGLVVYTEPLDSNVSLFCIISCSLYMMLPLFYSCFLGPGM